MTSVAKTCHEMTSVRNKLELDFFAWPMAHQPASSIAYQLRGNPLVVIQYLSGTSHEEESIDFLDHFGDLDDKVKDSISRTKAVDAIAV